MVATGKWRSDATYSEYTTSPVLHHLHLLHLFVCLWLLLHYLCSWMWEFKAVHSVVVVGGAEWLNLGTDRNWGPRPHDTIKKCWLGVIVCLQYFVILGWLSVALLCLDSRCRITLDYPCNVCVMRSWIHTFDKTNDDRGLTITSIEDDLLCMILYMEQCFSKLPCFVLNSLCNIENKINK